MEWSHGGGVKVIHILQKDLKLRNYILSYYTVDFMKKGVGSEELKT